MIAERHHKEREIGLNRKSYQQAPLPWFDVGGLTRHGE
jgi:hypothetical protein